MQESHDSDPLTRTAAPDDPTAITPPSAPEDPTAIAPPSAPRAALRPLHPRVISLWRIGLLLTMAGPTIALAVLDLTAGFPGPTGLAAFLVGVGGLIAMVLLPPARFRAWRYALRETDLFLRHGVLFRTTSIVPHARIQHVDTRHGPLDRWLGLASVVVYTAGTRGATLTIPGLEQERAEHLRDTLAELSGTGDAV